MTDTDEHYERLGKGYPYTLRPELHKALKVRGVDYWVAQGLTFWNRDDGCECLAYGYEVDGVRKLAIKVVGFTDPEQAIAATLGSGTCHDIGYRMDSTRFKCSQCGWDGWVRHAKDGRDYKPLWCPLCGAKVVDE